jgi:hypothetical protein
MSSTIPNLNGLSINKLAMSLGTRVRIIASVAHRLVVERSYIYKNTDVCFAANCLYK